MGDDILLNSTWRMTPSARGISGGAQWIGRRRGDEQWSERRRRARRGWGREGRREGVDTLTAGSGRLNVVEPDQVAVLARGHHMSKMNISLSSLGSNRGAVSSSNSKWKHSGQQQIGAFAVSTSRRCSFGMSCGQLSLNNKCVGLAFRQDKLYLLSFSENVNDMSTENENVFSSMNATNKRKRVHDVSSKL